MRVKEEREQQTGESLASHPRLLQKPSPLSASLPCVHKIPLSANLGSSIKRLQSLKYQTFCLEVTFQSFDCIWSVRVEKCRGKGQAICRVSLEGEQKAGDIQPALQKAVKLLLHTAVEGVSGRGLSSQRRSLLRGHWLSLVNYRLWPVCLLLSRHPDLNLRGILTIPGLFFPLHIPVSHTIR